MADPPARAPGPRRRTLAAAAKLFYRQGIQATGVAELCTAAGVSKKTLYQLFGDKSGLVAAYLQHLHDSGLPANEHVVERTDLPPRDRLLALFDAPPSGPRYRGCPFHNASVELTETIHPARAVVTSHKEQFLRAIIRAAREAGAADPELLGQQLLVLFEGATSLGTTMNDVRAFTFARSVASPLIEAVTAPPLPRPAHSSPPHN